MSNGIQSQELDPTVDHKLKRTWSIWVLEKQTKSTAWEEAPLRELIKCSSIVEFWRALNHLKLPRNLSAGTDYYFFEDGIKPVWEDPANIGGGSWSYVCRTSEQLDCVWLETIIGMIGEQFGQHQHNICGVRIQIRTAPGQEQRRDKVTLWTKKGSDGYVQEILGRAWKDIAQLEGQITYDLHGEWSAKKSLYKLA